MTLILKAGQFQRPVRQSSPDTNQKETLNSSAHASVAFRSQPTCLKPERGNMQDSE